MPSRHHKRSYRIIAIVLAFSLLGAAIFVPLGAQKEPNTVLIFVVLGIYLTALIGTIVINELIIWKKYKGDFLKKDHESDPED